MESLDIIINKLLERDLFSIQSTEKSPTNEIKTRTSIE